MDAVKIVPITQEHIESFHRTLNIVARERRYLAFLEAPPLESVRAFILSNIEQGYPQLVALSGGEVIGWCDVTPKPRPVYAHSAVLGIGLLPGFRRQGIGERLIRQAIAAAQALGLHRIELMVREGNAGAIELYKKVGFKVEGFQRDAVEVDGVYENLILMALLF
jgi:ribosomal protein S18 acetylase RimI-like enzyme